MRYENTEAGTLREIPEGLEELTVALAAPMRRVKELRATMKANEAAYAAELERLEEQHLALMQKDQAMLNHFLGEVERLGRMRLEYESDRKSVILLYGQIGTRKARPRLEVTDPAAVWAWIDDNHITDPVSQKPPEPKLSVEKLYKLQLKCDHAIPGTRLVDEGDRFFYDDSVTDGVRKVEAGERFTVETE